MIHSTSTCAAVTAYYANQLANRADFTWATHDVFTWIAAELLLLLICGSFPILKPLFDQLQQRLKLYIGKYSAERSHLRYKSKDVQSSDNYTVETQTIGHKS